MTDPLCHLHTLQVSEKYVLVNVATGPWDMSIDIHVHNVCGPEPGSSKYYGRPIEWL